MNDNNDNDKNKNKNKDTPRTMVPTRIEITK